MMLLYKLAAAVLVAAVLTLLLKKDQPAFAFLVSVCTAAGLLAIIVRQVQPLLDWLRTLDGYGMGGILADDMGLGKTVQVLSYLLAMKECGQTLPSLIVCPPSSCAAACWPFCRRCRCCNRCSARLRPICSSAFAGRTAACVCGRAVRRIAQKCPGHLGRRRH